MNTYGKNFTITIFGESHGPFAGVVIDGIKPGIKLSEEDFREDLERRKNGDIPSLSKGVTARQEEDLPIFISGFGKGLIEKVDSFLKTGTSNPKTTAPSRISQDLPTQTSPLFPSSKDSTIYVVAECSPEE